MKKKPELLQTGNRLTVKRFVQNLKENNLHYENKKITQCVFLGVLRLKPVPSVFYNRPPSLAAPTAQSRLKNSQRNSSNLKKSIPIKNEALTPKTAKKIKCEQGYIPSRKPVIKIDLTNTETEVKTEFKFEKLKLNPVRVILHNINRTRGPMEEDIKVEPCGEAPDVTVVDNPLKRMSLRQQKGREHSECSSPILLNSFEDTDYCFREMMPEVEKEVVVVSHEHKPVRTSPRFRQGSIDADENKGRRNKRRKSNGSTSSCEELSRINVKKSKNDSSSTRIVSVDKNNAKTNKRDVVLIREDPTRVTLSLLRKDAADLVAKNCDVKKNVRLTRSKSQSPMCVKKKPQTRSKSLSMSPIWGKTALFNTTNGNLPKKTQKNKLNPLAVDVRVKKESLGDRKLKRTKENPVLVQKNFELENLSDSEVELSSPPNSPVKMMRSQRESTESLTELDERDIETIQKDSAREKIKKTKFVMEGEDTQVNVEEKAKRTVRVRKIGDMVKATPAKKRIKIFKIIKIKKDQTAHKLQKVKKEKAEESNLPATKVLPARSRKSIYSKENLKIKEEPTDFENIEGSSSMEIGTDVIKNPEEGPKKRKKNAPTKTIPAPMKHARTRCNPAVVDKKRKTNVKRKDVTMQDLFASITKEIEVTPVYDKKDETAAKKQGATPKREDHLSDSDGESRSEWMPEDYADYKRNFEKQKKGASNQLRVFKCKICLMLFPSYYKLRKHDKDHINSEKPYECTLCDESFKNVLDLTAHIKVHKGKFPYQCRKCDKGFWEKDEFERHAPVHILKKAKPVENRFRCDVCAKEFAKLCDMERHLRVHTGEKPCVCNICAKRFQQSHNLSKHLLTHLHVRPFQCEICSKKFGRIDVLNRHLLTHSVEKPFSCQHCAKTFIRITQLEQHAKTKHPRLPRDVGSVVGRDDLDDVEAAG